MKIIRTRGSKHSWLGNSLDHKFHQNMAPNVSLLAEGALQAYRPWITHMEGRAAAGAALRAA